MTEELAEVFQFLKTTALKCTMHSTGTEIGRFSAMQLEQQIDTFAPAVSWERSP